MKCTRYLFALASALCLTSLATAAIIVDDGFGDNDRTDPALPNYSEAGVDADADGDIESSWFGTSGTISTSAGNLALGPAGVSGSSRSWATYFTDEAAPVTLANNGDQLKVTWQFSLAGAPTATNTSQNMRIAVVDTPGSARLASDTNPSSAAYTGYAVFLNMGPTLSRSNPMELKPRGVASGDLLSTGGNWTDVNADGGTNGATGYAADTLYTYMMTITRNGTGLQVDTSMSGGNLNDTGSISASYFDAAPTSFSFDTFTLRPSNSATTAEVFNTSLFRVEGPAIVPEPSAIVLFGLSALAAVLRRQR